MGIRTVEEYKESLRDGRRVYIRGEKVADITNTLSSALRATRSPRAMN